MRDNTMGHKARNQRVEKTHMMLLMTGKTWQSKSMTSVPIVEMSDGHLQNAIAMIERSGSWRKDILPLLKDEQTYRRRHKISIPRNSVRGT